MNNGIVVNDESTASWHGIEEDRGDYLEKAYMRDDYYMEGTGP